MHERVDLTNCDREPIHLLGRVQDFGFLIGVDRDWVITHVSENAKDFIGRAPDDLLGRPVGELLPDDTLHSIRNRLQFLSPHRGVEVVYDVLIEGSDRHFDASVHALDAHTILEFEVASPLEGAATDIANVRNAIDRMAELPNLEDVFSQTARFVKLITGFDRVMLYRFDSDGSGEVVAEAKQSELEAFLNLRYPASDIPRQARALYVENPIRLIASSTHEGIPVRALRDDGPLDLSGSRLRAVSPIHLEYLRNMDVAASMSISVIVNGALWGLIACHHGAPHVPSMRLRNAALLFGQMLSLILQTRLTAEERANDEAVATLTANISRTLSQGTSAPELLKSSAEAFAEVLHADGYAIVQDERVVRGGLTPEREETLALCDALNALPGNEVYATHHLAAFMPKAADFVERAAGVVAVPISRSPRDYLLFFRQELVRQVNWAGNPEKAMSFGPNGARLTPRKSFELWQTTVRGQSAKWTPADRRAAAQLRIMLLEVVLRLTDEAGRERKLANEKQELLIAELNHRVRNILGLVRGLIVQTRSHAQTAEDFFSKLDSRVQALARAHDQITRHNWGPAALTELLETEAESYLLDKKDRLLLEGPNVLLTSRAYSSLALVIHELITNSAKYGALSVPRGTVNVSWKIERNGSLKISWRELGGPPVQAPERRGFGTTIIERTIPFELTGKADVDYRLEGLAGTFVLPPEHVVPGETMAVPAARKSVVERQEVTPPQNILIVEDNLIIAMDAEVIFESLGAEEVVVHSSVEGALDHIENRDEPLSFALLDINLGGETSFPVALRLKELGVPFAFASGYGEGTRLPDELQDIRILSKPYDKDTVASLLG
ncbi:HWE histidine kinase domain-containing protein [Martelella endophytica]|uniref:Blue-light-activated histidine kinase n=1 Tax=Martelella endophytica TaxID=1486262 RepID=A0A0D5LXA5_MAREN|nr:HWE histidine kinase domain-containing protein [Martelella endophytica]AJY48422.1 histidine kinase [Martelella endophytica]